MIVINYQLMNVWSILIAIFGILAIVSITIQKRICSTIFIVLFLILIFAGFIIFPYQTVEYQNGYNSYPNNSIYTKASIISSQSIVTSEYTFYCEGYESAKYDALKSDIFTYNSTNNDLAKNSTFRKEVYNEIYNKV
jgi:hypothetical protein